MVESTRRQRLSLPVAPLVAALVGGLITVIIALVPTGILEDFVIDSGIAAILPAAEPPLGSTARALMILAAGGGGALVTWFGLFLLIGGRAIIVQSADALEDEEKAPVLRRADAHPDAPARRPLSAHRELGTPFLEVRAGRPVHVRAEESVVVEAEADDFRLGTDARALPDDLDTPLAAFDPEAIPEEPVEWLPKAAPLSGTSRQQLFAPGERFETFELTPMVRDSAPAPVHEPWPILAPEPTAAPWPIGAPTPPVDVVAAPPAEPSAPVEAPQPADPVRPRESARVEVDPSASIHALLDRLERGVGRRDALPPTPPPAREETLQEALVALRRLATQG